MGIPSICHHNKLPTTKIASTESDISTRVNVKHKAKPVRFLLSAFCLVIFADVV